MPVENESTVVGFKILDSTHIQTVGFHKPLTRFYSGGGHFGVRQKFDGGFDRSNSGAVLAQRSDSTGPGVRF